MPSWQVTEHQINIHFAKTEVESMRGRTWHMHTFSHESWTWLPGSRICTETTWDPCCWPTTFLPIRMFEKRKVRFALEFEHLMSIQLGVNPDHSCEHIPKSSLSKKHFEREIFRRYEYQYIVGWKILPVHPSYSTGPTFCCSDLGHFGRVANGPMGLESWRYLRFMYSDSWVNASL